VLGSTLRREGLKAFYSGYGTNLVRILPHYAIIFVLYEHFSHTFTKYIDKWENFID